MNKNFSEDYDEKLFAIMSEHTLIFTLCCDTNDMIIVTIDKGRWTFE